MQVLKLGDLDILDAWREAEDRHIVRLVTRPSVRKYIPAALKKRFNFVEFAFEDYLEYHKVRFEGWDLMRLCLCFRIW